MNYKIDEKNHEIFIYGNSNEIRKWIYCIDSVIANGKIKKKYGEQLDNLEHIVNFGTKTRIVPKQYLRIYFKSTDMVWFPYNYNLGENEKYWKLIKQYFEDTRKVYMKERLF